jgi:integrase
MNMAQYKDESRNTWYCKFSYQDWTGKRRQKLKRGFKTKRDAAAWERSFLEKQQGTPDMSFQSLYDLYAEDLSAHTRESTYRTRICLIKKHILPFWKDKKLNEITPADVRSWQGEIKKTALSEHTQYAANNYLSTMFNFAVKYYGLPSNPCRFVKTIGKIHRSVNFWTVDEFRLFLPTVQDPILRAALMTLFYSGIRCGELLALTVKDFDPQEKTITIRGTFHRFNRIDTITEPKTDNSRRVIPVPDFLAEELQSLLSKIYDPDPDERIFSTVTSSRLYTAIQKGAEAAGVKRIRVHDLRHSHVSLLINLDFPPLLIAERIGDSVDMVNRIYGHLYPSRHKEVAAKLEQFKL